MTISTKEIRGIESEDKILSNLVHDVDEPAGFERITRTRPPKRPIDANRVRQETRRPRREGKWK